LYKAKVDVYFVTHKKTSYLGVT